MPSTTVPAPKVPAPTGTEFVLYDRYRNTPEASVSSLLGPNEFELDPHESKRILDRVFLGHYLTDRQQCQITQSDLLLDRQTGNFLPYVSQMAKGSFTRANASQTLYVIRVGECGATAKNDYGSNMLVVFDGQNVVARGLTTGRTSIRGIFDLSGDGRQEILLTSEWGRQGVSDESIKLARFDGSALTILKDFGMVFRSDGEEETASVVRAIRGADGHVTYKVMTTARPCQ
jgi:hypothetical protein